MGLDTEGMAVNKYHGVRADDPGGRLGLMNPERGWRLETTIAQANGSGKGRLWPLAAERYRPFGLTMIQAYCYLTEFADRPIADEKLALLEADLGRLRDRGMKALLRFAYEDGTRQTGPANAGRILAHLDQLAPVIRANSDVTAVLQAGLVGAWGEWHSSVHGIEKDPAALAAIVGRILEILPPERMTQVRVPRHKRLGLGHPDLATVPVVDAATAHRKAPCARIGFHNDGFLARETCGGTWNEPPHFSNPGNPEFDYMTRESPFVPVDGELFWRDIGGAVDGFRAMRRMGLHHYDTFSLWHSYSGGEGLAYSIDSWMRQPVTDRQAREAGLPVDDGYFLNKDGDSAARTAFEYITDHLGYRFELAGATFPEVARRGAPFRARVTLRNNGFSAPFNPRPVVFALVDDHGRVIEFPCSDARPHDWHPYPPGGDVYDTLTHSIDLTAAWPADLAAGEIQLGLWLPDGSDRLRLDSRYAIRFANRDVAWWTDDAGRYGINLFGRVRVAE